MSTPPRPTGPTAAPGVKLTPGGCITMMASPSATPPVSAARVKRLSTYSSLQARGPAMSPSLSSKRSISRRVPQDVTPSPLSALGHMRRGLGGVSPVHLMASFEDLTCPSLAAEIGNLVDPPRASLKALGADVSGGTAKVEVFTPHPPARRRSSATEGSTTADSPGRHDPAEVVESPGASPSRLEPEHHRDFYESELLLYRELPHAAETRPLSPQARGAARAQSPAITTPAQAPSVPSSAQGSFAHGSFALPAAHGAQPARSDARSESALRVRGGSPPLRRATYGAEGIGPVLSPSRQASHPPDLAHFRRNFNAFTGDASPCSTTPSQGPAATPEVPPPLDGSESPEPHGGEVGQALLDAVRGLIDGSAEVQGHARRGSWLETARGIPRMLTSSAQRRAERIAVVDTAQEFARYRDHAHSAAAGDDGACGCSAETIQRHAGLDPEKVSAALLAHCTWCGRCPAAFLCLNCLQAVCPSHVRAHANDGGGDCALFVNILDIMTSYDRIFWCDPCERFTWLHVDPYEAVADRLVQTRQTYLAAAATDVFLRHYQIADRGFGARRCHRTNSRLTLSAPSDEPRPAETPMPRTPLPRTPHPQSPVDPGSLSPQPPGAASIGSRPRAATYAGTTAGFGGGTESRASSPRPGGAEPVQKLFASVATMQGWRSTQEDAEVVFAVGRSALGVPAGPAPGDSAAEWRRSTAAAGPAESYTALCVFDGHGGDAVARLAAEDVESCFVRCLRDAIAAEVRGAGGDAVPYATCAQREVFFGRVLRDTLVHLDETILRSPEGIEGLYNMVGCTATVVLVTEAEIVCASAGDTRAVLYDVHRARTVPLSEDHTLALDAEVARVKAAHHTIIGGRIEGMLAVPRALGDYDFKQASALPPERQAVTCVPDVTYVARASLVLGPDEVPAFSPTCSPGAATAALRRLSSGGDLASSVGASTGASTAPPQETLDGTPVGPLAAVRRRRASSLCVTTAHAPEDWFIVVACDGIWDVTRNEEACAVLQDSFVAGRRAREAEEAIGALGAALDTPSGADSRALSPAPSVPSPRMSAAPLPSTCPSMNPSFAGPPSLEAAMHLMHPPALRRQPAPLFSNTYNDVVAEGALQLLRRSVAKEANDDGLGMDNMSLIVARLGLGT